MTEPLLETPQNRFQEQFGTPKARTAAKVRDSMSEFVQEYIRHSSFVVLATSDRDGKCDTSPKGGKPGFVKIIDDRHLIVPDVAGNRLFQSYHNLDQNPHVGLLFLIPGVDETVRVNGTVTILDQEELRQRQIEMSIHSPDDNSRQLQGLLIEVDESFSHCPRAFKFSKLWDVDQIGAHRVERPISQRPVDG
tara:strand:- start:8428 stop:9003 length:576 start_codon:yes stop_codon:yes gene_type:complete